MVKKIQAIGMGGTFDHFHAGHQKFIRYAFEQAEQVFIGVTNEKMTRGKKLAHVIEPFPDRLQAVKAFCHQNHIRAKVNQLEDEFGPTLEGAQVQALCVTPETAPGADKINAVRAQLGMYKLPVFLCDYELDENGQPIHSENIRAGKVNRTGTVYSNLFKSDFSLSNEAREFFSQPQGKVSTTKAFRPSNRQQLKDMIVVVGDSSLEQFKNNNWPYHLGVYDRMQQRQAYSSELLQAISPNFTVENPAGVITKELVNGLKQQLATANLAKPSHILVNGEEDLAAVALILLLPLEAEVYYGQPDQGMVRMKITEDLKAESYQVLSS